MIVDQALAQVLGVQTPPKAIAQLPFDGDDGHYHRLCALTPGERPRGTDLVDYALDLRHQAVLQEDLFRYLLPICLAAWREELFGDASYALFVETFYLALVRGRIFERMLDARATSAVAAHLREAILEVIDRERGLRFAARERRPHKWVRAVSTYGVLFPDLDVLWTSWWNIDSRGKALAVVQYASCLMYPESENPIFDPWTREEGGGPPTLWAYEGDLSDDCWKAENVDFLERTLTPDYLRAKLTDATTRLQGDPEHAWARRVREDFDSPTRLSIVARRCVELPRLFARPRIGSPLHWSET